MAPAAPSAGARTPSTETTGSGSSAGAAAGATVAGVGVTTLAIAGGAVVAAGMVVAAASGGEDGPSGGGNGGGDVNLTGTWSGPWTTMLSGGGLPATTCASEVTMNISHSGGSISGSGSSGAGQCSGAAPGGPVNTMPGSGTFSGTASNGRVTFSIPFGDPACPAFQYTGTYTASTMSGTMNHTCTLGGIQINWSGTWSMTRR
jgi:hypothetical protein